MTTEQPTDPTAVRDFVMVCADDYARCRAESLPHEYAQTRLQQAVEWAMARARMEAHRPFCAHYNELEADAAEKWRAMQ